MTVIKYQVSCPNCGGNATHNVAVMTNEFPIEFLEDASFQCESCNEETHISIEKN